LKTERLGMAYRLLLAYAFVRPESEQNSSYPTFPRAGVRIPASSGLFAMNREISVWRGHCFCFPLMNDFFARRSAHRFSSCYDVCLLDQVFQHQFSDLVFDGDRRGKL
jgi:hypothetical protein